MGNKSLIPFWNNNYESNLTERLFNIIRTDDIDELKSVFKTQSDLKNICNAENEFGETLLMSAVLHGIS